LYDFRFEPPPLPWLARCRLPGEAQAALVTAMAPGGVCEPLIK